MKLLLIAAAACLLFASCRKTMNEISSPGFSTRTVRPQSCDFGIKNFNTVKRPDISSFARRTPRTTSGTNLQQVLLLDFDGEIISNTAWNTNGPINCSAAALTSTEMDEIFDRVSEDYRPFNITITTDDSIYQLANPTRRMRVIITDSWEWYGQAGGVSYIGSFTWGDNTPCFIFSSLLNYNVKNISEAISHEAGHTFGLKHQSVFDAACGFQSEYNYGSGSGEIGWAPIMGCPYSENMSTWYNGPTIYGCTSYQDDIGIIASMVGFRPDDYGNTIQNSKKITGSINGIINNNSDVDFFQVNFTSAVTVNAVPFNVGAGNSGANLDVLMKIYNQSKTLVYTINDPAILSATQALPAGKYFISIQASGNAYASPYGVMGQYSLLIN
jgi:hypothetical protein